MCYTLVRELLYGTAYVSLNSSVCSDRDDDFEIGVVEQANSSPGSGSENMGTIKTYSFLARRYDSEPKNFTALLSVPRSSSSKTVQESHVDDRDLVKIGEYLL